MIWASSVIPFCMFSDTSRVESHMSNEQKPWLFRVYRGWDTTQFFRDYFINHYNDPYQTTSISIQWKAINTHYIRCIWGWLLRVPNAIPFCMFSDGFQTQVAGNPTCQAAVLAWLEERTATEEGQEIGGAWGWCVEACWKRLLEFWSTLSPMIIIIMVQWKMAIIER